MSAPPEARPTTDPAAPPPQAPPRRRRRLWWLLPLAPVAPVVAAWVILYASGDARLKRALDETDRLDPHWHLADVLAEREPVPDEENGALVSIAARKKMPVQWPVWDMPPSIGGESEGPLAAALQALKPNQTLSDEELCEVSAELDRAADALEEARKLAGMPRGRFNITYSKDFISTLLPNIQDARGVAYVLQYDAMFRAMMGDFDTALRDCLALVNCARSVGDEPMLIPQLVRMAIRAIAVGQAERALAQGEPGAEAMAALQRAFEREAEEPLIAWALRGERAGMDQFMQSLQDGHLSIKQMQGMLAGGPNSRGHTGEELLLYLPGTKVNARATLLERMNRMIEISKLPPEEQVEPLKKEQATLAKEPLLVREIMPAVEKVSEAERRTRGLLRCAAAGLAAERYRQKHGRWPETLDDLKGEFLDAVPRDPYDNRPLRYRRDDDGAVIWCLGKDRTDDGGDRAKLNTYKDGTDVGFRLWDVGKR
ncbi:MAG TPA: hypothetical protein VFW33_06570, partial [Gemmataceae bacterium]|nr:hypothetical protein [Gemmataceae bacterium]